MAHEKFGLKRPSTLGGENVFVKYNGRTDGRTNVQKAGHRDPFNAVISEKYAENARGKSTLPLESRDQK